MIKTLITRKFLLIPLILLGIFFGVGKSQVASAGWGGAFERASTSSSPYEPCRLAWEGWGCSDKPDSPFQGYISSQRWDIKNCVWPVKKLSPTYCTQLDSTRFVCPAGGTPVSPGRCVNEIHKERPGCESPSTPNPINILTGSKILEATDFVSGDQLFKVRRLYRSQADPTAATYHYAPRGLAFGWHFDFMPEIHFSTTFSTTPKLTVHWPDGASYNFKKDGTDAKQVNLVPDNDRWGALRVSFNDATTAAWPTSLANINSTSTLWKVTDAEGNTWVFKSMKVTTNDPFIVALPISRTTRDGYKWTYHYNSVTSQLTSIEDSFNRVITFHWLDNGLNEIDSIQLFDGTSLSYLNATTSPYIPPSPLPPLPKQQLRVVKRLDTNSNVLDKTTYLYGDLRNPSAVTGIMDAQGLQLWNFGYDDKGRAILSERFGGLERYEVFYDSTTQRTVTNPMGRKTIYKFTSDRLDSMQGQPTDTCTGDLAGIKYDTATGYVTTKTDKNGNTTTFSTWDNYGRPTTITQATGKPEATITTLKWHDKFDLIKEITKSGLTTIIDRDPDTGRVNSITQKDIATSDERQWRYTYITNADAEIIGKLYRVYGPLPGDNDYVEYGYDSFGNLATITNELSQVTTVLRSNSRGQPVDIKDMNDVFTHLDYYPTGKIKSVEKNSIFPWTAISPAAAITSFEYDAAWNVTRVILPDGISLRFQYNYSDGTIIKILDAQSNYMDLYYNNARQIVGTNINTSYGILAETRNFVYDDIGRILKLVGYDNNSFTQWSYQNNPEEVTITDPQNAVTKLAFDGLHRLSQVTDPGIVDGTKETISTGYNANNKNTSVTQKSTNTNDKNSLVTTYTRNGFGDIIQISSPDTGITTYKHELKTSGWTTTVTDARNVVVTIVYDVLKRIKSKTFPTNPLTATPKSKITYTYDDFSPPTTPPENYGKGKLTSIVDPSGTTTMRYDVFGRLYNVKRVFGSQTYDISYKYDKAGRLTSIQYPSGRLVTFVRADRINRVSGITTIDPSTTTLRDVLSAVIYARPFAQSILFQDSATAFAYGKSNKYALKKNLVYDYDGHLTNITASFIDAVGTNETKVRIQDLKLEYYNIGKIHFITDNLDSTRNQTFEYDPSGRLKMAKGLFGSSTTPSTINYTYDVFGNRKSTKLNEVYNYGLNKNRLDNIKVDTTFVKQFLYNNSGAVTSDSSKNYTYEYNGLGQLTKITASSKPAESRSYIYDAFNHRVSEKMVQANTERAYIYDKDGHLIAEYTQDSTTKIGTVQKEYVWFGETPVAVIDAAATGKPMYFIHTDHLNRPQKITDASNNIVVDIQYDPFGDNAKTIKDIGKIATILRLPGQEEDLTTHLSQNWNRMYDPTLGRYLQSDPIGLAGGINTYGYAEADPVNNIDPTGLDSWTNSSKNLDALGSVKSFMELSGKKFSASQLPGINPGLPPGGGSGIDPWAPHPPSFGLNVPDACIGDYCFKSGLGGDDNPIDDNREQPSRPLGIHCEGPLPRTK